MRLSQTSLLALLPLLTSAQLLTVTLPNEPASVSAEPTPSSTPLPSAADNAYWSPLLTRTIPISIPIPTSDTIFHNDLRARAPDPQATGQGIVPVIQPGQVPAETTVQLYSVVGGSVVQIQVVYTQLFTTPLDPWPAAQAGTIGLGTIQGQVGVVKTKRSVEQTQVPVAVLSDESLKVISEIEIVSPIHDHVPEEAETVQEQEEPAVEPGCHNSKKVLENKTGKAMDLTAGSALALILAIAAMVVA